MMELEVPCSKNICSGVEDSHVSIFTVLHSI